MSDITDLMAGAFADQVESMRATEEEFEAHQKAQREKIDEVFAKAIAQSQSRQNAREMPESVKEIANALTLQPQLIPPVQKFLESLTSQINSAVTEILKQHGTSDG